MRASICLGLALLLPTLVEARPRARRVAMSTTRRAPVTASSEPSQPAAVAQAVPPEPATLPGAWLDPPPAPAPAAPRRWGLFAGGMTLLLAGYGADIGLSYGLGVERAALSLLPVFGPLAQMGQSWSVVAPSSTGNPAVDGPANQRIEAVNAAAQKIAYAVLALDFALQASGLAMAIVGALPPRRGAAERAPQAGRIALVPVLGAGHVGLAGRF